MPNSAVARGGDESELAFADFAAFLDPPKESVKAALQSSLKYYLWNTCYN